MTEDEMIRQHHRLNGHELEQTPGDSEGQGKFSNLDETPYMTAFTGLIILYFPQLSFGVGKCCLWACASAPEDMSFFRAGQFCTLMW